jgi:DNA-binding MarR family transcriptional regulator
MRIFQWAFRKLFGHLLQPHLDSTDYEILRYFESKNEWVELSEIVHEFGLDWLETKSRLDRLFYEGYIDKSIRIREKYGVEIYKIGMIGRAILSQKQNVSQNFA